MFDQTLNTESTDSRNEDKNEELEKALLDLQCLIVPGSRLDHARAITGGRPSNSD